MAGIPILKERESQIYCKGERPFEMSCGKQSPAGSISQRACVFCGSRVVLYPIADALHLVHGPIGCAAYTWDIRGALSSGPELYRSSFSTDLQERDVIFGGEKKLYASLNELIDRYAPKAAFVYSTCIVGLIGDDVEAVCRRVAREKGIPVLPVHSEGFKGTKKDGYKAACEALFKLIGRDHGFEPQRHSINILGEFNIGGEAWVIRNYYERMGIQVVSVMTGDGRVDEIGRSHRGGLNLVQCSGSMTYLAKMMEEKWSIPFIRVSYFGIEDMSKALYDVASHFHDDRSIMERTEQIVMEEVSAVYPRLQAYRRDLAGKKAAIYVGGPFKVLSLMKALRHIGMDVVLAGSQTGTPEDYAMIKDLCDEGTVIVDDASSLELSKYIREKGADLVIGGVKERPIAYKMGIGFCDHNHERKIPLAGYVGMLNFAREVHDTVGSPVWDLLRPDGAEARSGVVKKGEKKPAKTATQNGCKLCTPLGAALVFKGVRNAVPLLHGSQGCSTYIRRYLISHFREPVDIACSNFGEETAVFGGEVNLTAALENIRRQYAPELIGVATTCLSETIGDDVAMFLRRYGERAEGEEIPAIVHVSTPSYQGTHIDGFHGAVRETVRGLASREGTGRRLNLFPGMVSPADLRYLKEVVSDFGLTSVFLPDYSETLDGPPWSEYHPIPRGGTPVEEIRAMGSAGATVEFGRVLSEDPSAGKWLKEQFHIPLHSLGMPIGVRESDRFFKTLEEISGRETPEKHREERRRLLDACVDGHKYVSFSSALVYGEEDLVVGLSAFLCEIGVIPVICASGGRSGRFRDKIEEVARPCGEDIHVFEDVDFSEMEGEAQTLKPDFLIGGSKGYALARKLALPLVRVGFPIHDRFGGQRVLHMGYRGGLNLLDQVINTLMEHRQRTSDVGYSYM